MNRVTGFLAFLYDFIVGDDWRMSISVVAGLAATWGAVRLGFNPWWLLPVFVVAGLAISLRRVVNRNRIVRRED